MSTNFTPSAEGQPCAHTYERHSRLCQQAQRYEQLAIILFEFYHVDGPVTLLDVVLELFRACMDLVTVCDHSRAPSIMAYVGGTLVAICEVNYNLKALDQAIKLYERALHPDVVLSLAPSRRCYVQVRLAYALYVCFRFSRRGEDCQVALDLLNHVQNTIQGSFNQSWMLIVMGLLKGTNAAWQFMSQTPTGDDLLGILKDLRNVRMSGLPRYLYLLSLITEGHLVEAIFGTKAQPPTEPLHAIIASMESGVKPCPHAAYLLRFKLLMSLSNLHFLARNHVHDEPHTTTHLAAAVDHASQARSMGDSMGRNIYHNFIAFQRWAKSSMQLATHMQDLDAMERTLDAMRDAVRAGPLDTRIPWMYQDALINNLIVATGLYFYQSGRVSVIDDLVVVLKNLGSDDLVRSPLTAGNFAQVLLERALIADKKVADTLIDQAVTICLARQNMPNFGLEISSERAFVGSQLLTASRMQIRAGNRPILDPETAFNLAQQHLANSRLSISSRMKLIQTQIEALIWQLHSVGDVTILEQGHTLLDRELSSLGDEDFSAMFEVDLQAARAELFFAQATYDHANKASLCQRAWDHYERAVHVQTRGGHARERFQACLRWASQAMSSGYPLMALRAYSCAIETLPQVVFLGDEVIGRIEALRQVSGLAAASVATALTVGETTMAIDFLERTRGILWLQSVRIRETVTQLAPVPTSLRNRLTNVVEELGPTHRFNWTTRRHKAEELEEVISKIRTFPGLERFQLPPLLHEIQARALARKVYAVIVIPSDTLCDVMIFGLEVPEASSNVGHIRLPAINAPKIRDMSQRLDTSCDQVRGSHVKRNMDTSRKVFKAPMLSDDPNHSIVPLLSQLWTTLVHPILQYLNLPEILTLDDRKRLFWCPIGPLSSLPLHAAGIYEGPSPDHVGNYVISSYIPSMSSLYRLLTDSHMNQKSPTSAPSKMLLVGQPTSSAGRSALANVDIEIEEIKAVVPSRYQTNINTYQNMTVQDTLDGLSDAAVLHLACHGNQDQDDPLNSGFDLHDGRLTLAQLMQLDMPHAQLAYLSACDSAGMDESRPDEGLNLAGTMIFVGFRSVVGTMWAMDDLDGPFMAKRIYARVFKDGHLNLDAVPYAMDDAVRQLPPYVFRYTTRGRTIGRPSETGWDGVMHPQTFSLNLWNLDRAMGSPGRIYTLHS